MQKSTKKTLNMVPKNWIRRKFNDRRPIYFILAVRNFYIWRGGTGFQQNLPNVLLLGYKKSLLIRISKIDGKIEKQKQRL